MNAAVDFRGIRPDATVVELMKPMRHFLDEDDVIEVCVNRPHEVFVERYSGWERIDVPELSFEHCRSLAMAVATLTGQFTNEVDPLLSSPLPTGERIQFVQPSACPADTLIVCIRKPASFLPRLDDFERDGLFDRVRGTAVELKPFEHELFALKEQRRFAQFFRLAVHHHQTILVAGKTGSGKTTFMKALVEEVPLDERLITIEDAAELLLPSHRNKVHLFYSKNRQGASAVSAKQLLEACLRLRPDRILLAEVRGEEAYYFLRLATSGHPGSVTSIHAGSCEQAFEQLALMVRESSAGGGMTTAEIKKLARSVVDVVVHFDKDDGGRHITDIYYDPASRLHTLGRGDELETR